MEIEVSTKAKKLARQYRLRPQDMAFADLIAVGWDAEDAWNVAVREGMAWNKSAKKEAIYQLQHSDYVSERIKATKAVLRKDQIESMKNVDKNDRKVIVNEAMSKESMLYDLQSALVNMDTGSKEWLDTKKLIIEVTRMKQDEVKDDTTTVHHFLPARYPTGCQDCLFSKCDECIYKKDYEQKEGQ